MVDHSQSPAQIDMEKYKREIGAEAVASIEGSFKDFKYKMHDLGTLEKSGKALVQQALEVAKEVDEFNEVEFAEAKQWATMLDDIEANIDTITIDEVLGRFPQLAQQIDEDIEDYWWRPEDKVEPGAHSHH